MIPLTVAEEIRATLLDYLTTTFNFQDQAVEQALLDFLAPKDKEQPGEGLFKGPYISLRLPFRKADPDARLPLEIHPSFIPYAHQVRAFERLSARDGHQPEPTLITTGTGSGKTECFLYPILDNCYARRGEPGIKAIILYPMNALATDQAGRLAHMLWEDERLKGQVTAGIYIGGQGEQIHTTMSADHLVDDRETLRKHPPDILLTNYKMLDFLLLRPEDKTLWAENNPDTLRFLVLDELHTYDGAQGSDVACLIRRLKARLRIPDGVLCPIGTSATVTSEKGDTRELLIDYAEEIFGVVFESASVIVEDRLNLEDFIPEPATLDAFPVDIEILKEINGESYTSYIQRQCQAWFGKDPDPVQLAGVLQQHSFLDALLTQLSGSILALDELIERLQRWDPAFAGLDHAAQTLVIQSFLALISHARTQEENDLRPFLTCQVQLWVREISRLMRQVSREPRFFWRDDVPLASERRGMPAYFCRECGHTGWLTMMRDGDDYLNDDLKTIYGAYFSHSRHVRYVYPALPDSQLKNETWNVCPSCLTVSNELYCKACHENTLTIHIYIETSTPKTPKQQPNDLQRCPLCGTDGALSIVGSQAASLSSVAISHLYTTPLNQDKKLLAFTDSVQDASHRASFFEARTYRFSLRTAIQGALKDGQPARLDTLIGQVLDHWRQTWQGHKNCDQRLVATFMPPDLRDLPVYHEYMESSEKTAEAGMPTHSGIPSELEHDLLQRLSWEVIMEYGFTARVGRSLERVGSSVAYIDPECFHKAVDGLALILPEEIGSLQGLQHADVRHFCLGLLERTRLRGGVTHPMLDHYALEQGNWYLLTHKMQPLLSPFHKNSPRFPRFLTDAPNRDVFDLFIASGARRTWYTDWAQKTLGQSLGVAEINEIYRIAIPFLAQKGILRAYSKGHANAYCINPQVLWVTNRAVILKCDHCGNLQTVADSRVGQWLDRTCLSYRCNGCYTQKAQPDQHYYREVYQRGQVERIFAHEHTGLLRRDKREKVERQFKMQTRADATNLLAATPTLELGIDIGDLSSTMACSVPPAPANYLQRIGRAGRKTGNSLILTLANAQPHDLYFFEEPLEMMAGTITPPGCFLDAPDMLKRQILAFNMDTWTATDPKATLLPRDVQKMLAGVKKGGFPENLLAFIEKNHQELIEHFLEIFGEVVSPENQERLRAYAVGDALPSAVRTAVAEVEAEREELRAARKALKTRREKIEADPAQYQNPEVELKRLAQDMALILDMIKQLEDQYILNFFTDAGLLPNYAFPETGVRLTAVISGVNKPGDDRKGYDLREYVRPAPLALRELAPFNHFYAEGQNLTISHVDIAGREKSIERWQFCDQCSHMELVQASHYSAVCPNCGSTMWSDHGQQHNMVRFRKASAYVDGYESRVGDDGDERERRSYQTSHFFEMGPENSRGAYLLPKLPFGIEYMEQVTLREINFGPTGTISQNISIAGEDRPEQGFRTCRDCGLSVETMPNPNAAGSLKHTRNCASLTNSQALEWENIYLFRQVTSEAIRILLPVSTTMIEEKMATFEACLDLGLRKKFRGNPDHLHILPHTEPAEDGSRRRFLVIYDSVPGGTGFLRDLARPDNFFEILQLALDALMSCRCRLIPEKQACYRCLYSYRVQRELKLISRRLGIEMLSEILGQRQTLETIPSLSHIHMDSLIESELEQRLIYALEKHCKGKMDHSFTPTIFNGKQAWELIIGAAQWMLEPQVNLGHADKVSVPSKADFVLWPQKPSSAKPVAVFTDGFIYHVRPQESTGGLGDDILKRRALIASGKFLVWSITWDDVKEFESGEPLELHFFDHDQHHFAENAVREMRGPLSERLLHLNAVVQLLEYLQYPHFGQWADTVAVQALATLRPLRPPVGIGVLEEKAHLLVTSLSLPDLTVPFDTLAGDYLYGIIEHSAMQLFIYVPMLSLKLREPEAFHINLRLDDTFERRSAQGFRIIWRQFWLLANLYQFLPNFVPLSAEYIQLASLQSPIYEQQVTVAPDAWGQVFEYAAPEVTSLLQTCQTMQIEPPLVGYELVDSGGKIIAVAELAWEERRLAVLLSISESDRESFTEAGWQTFHPDQIDLFLEKYSNG